MIYVVSFDLNNVADYDALYTLLEEEGAFDVSDSTWLLCSDDDAETLFTRLTASYYNDTLVVLPLGEGAIGGSDEDIEAYLAGCRGEYPDDEQADASE